MAIQVNGTTVIDNSRNLQNVQGIKTVGGQSILGSGNISAGASTTAGDVGTYTWGRPQNGTDYNTGSTASSVYAVSNGNGMAWYYNGIGWYQSYRQDLRSGTWRAMAPAYKDGNANPTTLWVRIS